MVSLPLVSIIIPTFNRASLIDETLDSVLEQTYQNWECLIVDDGSSDDTDRVVNAYVKKDSRFNYYHRPEDRPKGANSCRNYGFELSLGKYIQWLDSDDLIGSNKVSAQIKVLESACSRSISTCRFGYFTKKNKLSVRQNITTYRNFNKGLDLLNHFGNHNEYFPAHVYLVKKSLIEHCGIWDTNLMINQDGVFFTQLLLESKRVFYVNENVYYRKASSLSTSTINSSDKAEALINSWKQIDSMIITKTGQTKSNYVETAKKIIYHQILDKYPKIVEKNYDFFNSIIPFYKRIFYRF